MIISAFEKISWVQCYIHHVKNIQVEIIPPKTPRQIMLLDMAYNKARQYFHRP